ncbi:MAG: hypothetical protein H6719_02015 [Sandaracinaceae bacterium]|nr:hypothetical protein [Sandaracinaceae bacterium]
MRRAWLAAGLLASSLGLGGCNGLPTGDTVLYAAGSPELANATVSPEGVWESSPWSGDGVLWLPYPAQATIDVEHGLGRVPRDVDIWISFEADGDAPAPASGDLARLIAIDESMISVRNSTNVVLYARITLQ